VAHRRVKPGRAAKIAAERADGPPAEWLARRVRQFQRVAPYDAALDPDGHGPPKVSEADARGRALQLWESSTSRKDEMRRRGGARR
jgi:hypothetical protein